MIQIRAHHLTPVVVVSPSATDLTSTSTWSAWTTPVITFAREVKPEYLCVGNEINKGLTDVARTSFLNRLPQLVNDIHTASPTTQVCVTLQYEWLNGLRGGLFGGQNDPANVQWSVLAQVESVDLIGLTTYPGLIYHDPSELPNDYYTRLMGYTTKPVALTEIGWSHGGSGEWVSSSTEQAACIRALQAQADSIHPRFMLWSFLYDPNAKAPFNAMGLLAPGETTSAAWEAWKQ